MSSGRSSRQDAETRPGGFTEPFYSNEDVAILHDIVVLAQERLPGLSERERLPTNALFNAYYDILPRIGIHADHDNRYARVLFKIGGLRGPGALYQKFEEILSKMGIEIEFGQDDEEEGLGSLENFGKVGNVQQDENSPIQTLLRRRNSESSLWDLGLPNTPNTPKHQNRRNSFNTLEEVKETLPAVDQLQQSLQSTSREQTSAADFVDKEAAYHVRTWLESRPRPAPSGRDRSISTDASSAIRPPSRLLPRSHNLANRDTRISVSDEFLDSDVGTAVTSAYEQELSERLGGFQTLHHGKELSDNRNGQVSLRIHYRMAKRYLQLWRDQALQLQEDHRNLNDIAIQKDKSILLRLALETWHNRFQVKRQIVATERFFAHLERRSERARNFYLLFKAFDHWRVTAQEAVDRTRSARRHVVQSRMFNSWRDVTAVNELKVRRQVLRKFFTVWKNQHVETSTKCTAAIQFYQGGLVKKICMQWFRKLCDIRATAWWKQEVKQGAIFNWILASQRLSHHSDLAMNERNLQLAWKACCIWRNKVNWHVTQSRQAQDTYQRCLTSSSLRKWRRETRVVPARKSLQTEVATRLIQETFRIWLLRCKQERHATLLDRSRIVQEAWTNWRLKLRLRVLQQRAEQMVTGQTFYKWILAKRSLLACRASERNLLRKSLGNWELSWDAQVEQSRAREDAAQRFNIERIQASVLNRLSSYTRASRELGALASSSHHTRLVRATFTQWSARTKGLVKLQLWSRDADFYFLALKFLKQWRSSTESVQRERRKAAYSQVRRTSKTNLVRRVFGTWRTRARRISQLQGQAANMRHNKDVVMAMDEFDRWRILSQDRRENEVRGEEVFREQQLKRFFAWRKVLSNFRDLQIEAMLEYQERQQDRIFKKWKLVVLRLQAQSFYATEVHEKSLKRTCRRIFAYWRQKAGQLRPYKRETTELLNPDQFRTTTRPEAWSNFEDENGPDEAVDDFSTRPPVPGYLSTPSKRTGRALAAAARFSSTTPRAPLSTPFERQLRAQYSGGFLSPLKKRHGVSRLEGEKPGSEVRPSD